MLSLPPALFAYALFVTFVLGLVFGSFCNAWAWRLAHGENISNGRSHCADCGHVLAARDLVPLFSFLALRGRCRYCGAPIARRYPAAEVLSAAFFLSAGLRLGYMQPLVLLRWLCVGALVLTLCLVDWEIQEIPDRLLAGLALVFAVFVPLTEGAAGVRRGLLGAVAVSVPLLVLVLLADRVLGRESMGGGDIKLIAALGLHFGAARTLLVLVVGCIVGILFALASRRKNENGESKAFAFGPALGLGAWIVFLIGTPFINWYLGLFF